MPSHGPSSLELLTQRTGADAETDPKVEKAWKALQKGKCSSFGQIYDPAYFLCELISIVRILAQNTQFTTRELMLLNVITQPRMLEYKNVNKGYWT